MQPKPEPLPEQLTLTAILQALSDPTRMEVVRTLHDTERHCSEFDTTLSKPSLSHHFRVLREAGLTHTRKEGRYNMLSLRHADLENRFPGLLAAILVHSDADREGDAVVMRSRSTDEEQAQV